MVGGVWNGFLLGRVRGQPVPCRFCGAPDGDGHLFLECTFPPLVEIRENPEFHDLMRLDKGRCLLWHGWLRLLSGVGGACPWAADASQSACHVVETALGPYSPRLITDWSVPDGFDAVGAAAGMPDAPNVWTDGSLVPVKSIHPTTENWPRKLYQYSKKNYKSTEDKHETNHINNKFNDTNMNTRKMHNT